VGISEHMPMPEDALVYPDEKELGLTAQNLIDGFRLYFKELDRLKEKYQGKIQIYKGLETECVTGSLNLAKKLIRKYRPDYIVGSVHHVNDTCFDYSIKNYESIARDCGSMEAMYIAYFDAQFEMIQTLCPFVVGHFDIIRIYDDMYLTRLEQPEIKGKIQRNLSLIKELGLVLDYNLRPLAKGEDSPYLAPSILDQAKDLGIPVVPGDDAHSKSQAGGFVAEAVQHLEALGFSTQWPVPKIMPCPGTPS